MKNYIVILAGGGGTRLWPASQKAHPKQFLDFGTGLSLYQRTLKRALGLKGFDSILVVTHQNQMEAIKSQSQGMMKKESAYKNLYLLPEPEAKNTAPAIAYACAYLRANGEKSSTILVMPADHLIEPLSALQADLKKAWELASADFLVTFGIVPNRPETGYGYIKCGRSFKNGYQVLAFIEKPNYSKAAKLLKKRNYFWNSGIFVFKEDLFRQELLRHKKEIAEPFLSIDFGFKPKKKDSLFILPVHPMLKRIYQKLPALSIDSSLMEKSKKQALVKASFNWDDAGSWDQVAQNFIPQKQKLILTQAKNNFVFSDLPVALVGVEDLHVIVKNNIVLVCKKGYSALIKKTVSLLEAKNRGELL
jgi:mannose-1-phosphate guanylyltransferase/mannose-6-phosphate isomerase